ncbi:mitoferrin-2 isoform 1-T1 [Rhynchonycteris naso]
MTVKFTNSAEIFFYVTKRAGLIWRRHQWLVGGVSAGPSRSRRPGALWAAPEADATGPGGGGGGGGSGGEGGRRSWPGWMELEGRGAGSVAGGPAAGPGRSPGESALLDGWLQRGVGRGAGGGEAGACRPPVRQDPDSDPDYEALPAGATVTTHMVAGAVAGILEHCVMYPIDCVKTRMQSLQPDPAARYRNVLEALWRIIRTEGLWRPMRGLNVTATGAGPAHALYFACYEKLKKTLSDVIHPGGNSHIANGAAGCVATLLHDAAMNPAEVVKQRMQMYNSPYHRVTDCVRAVWQNEGAGAFYRSYTTQLTMNVPFQAIHFMTYEFLQEHFNPQRRYNPSSHVLSGACAGAVAAAVTTPLDVCKTLLNTQESLALNSNFTGHITGMASAFRTVYQVGGVTAYFRGVQARVIYQIPSTAIAWSVYEFFKYLITKRQEEWRAGK